ncbi:MAG TPA: alpha-amylase/4-alpha-glucanotransferase domain-containing protein, partial [Candidatus Acidoferrales bacterium]|nr:alpha-amylase/4-alpha-glucanotransferase domain-containing protein [Candidatus Acidoferrales bacterium]
MKKINLVIGIHNHQPIGNFDHVIEEAYKKSYRPFLEVLEKFPRIKISQHYTGFLFEWLKKNHPEIFSKLKSFIKSGQVRLMTGGFYEPILAIIPDKDKLGQIRKLNEYIEKNFKFKPTGMWLAERVWEQHIVKPIAECGVSAVVIDDTHFKYAGLKDEDLLGYYVTEEQGSAVNIFPISKSLRYSIPFQPVEKTIEYLRSVASEDGTRIAVYADDGEKFGVWPNTHKHVYEDKWLEEFFSALEENSDWINILHFSEVLEKVKPIGRVYLQNASYSEMLHWALWPELFEKYEEFENKLKSAKLFDTYEEFVRGGYWRNFLAKYPESNNIHKKMIRLSERAHALERKGMKMDHVLDKIWAAQCNDPYWHGIFGGLYLPNLRYPVYKSLIQAEVGIDKMENKKKIAVTHEDFDRDGSEEILVESNVLDAYFKPEEGGMLFELDYKPIPFNVLDILSRRPEGYHKKLKRQPASGSNGDEIQSIHDMVVSKETGLEKLLNYDWYRRASFIDHFVGDTTLEEFAAAKYHEKGDFVLGHYGRKISRRGGKVMVQFSRDGNADNIPLRITKNFELAAGSGKIICKYKIENLSAEELHNARGNSSSAIFDFGVEFNFGLMAGDAYDRYYMINNVKPSDPRMKSSGGTEAVR